MGALSSLAPLAMMAMMMNQQNQAGTPCPGGTSVPKGQQCPQICPGSGVAMPQGMACPPVPQANGYASPDGVVQANGQLDCTKPLAFRYSQCNSVISQACMTNITTMMTSQVCTNFSARYCNQGYVAPQVYSPYPYPLVAGQVIGNQIVTTPSPVYDTDHTGEGVGSAHCLRVYQISFCASAANAQCPSCQQLNTAKSAACATNPAICAMQSSPQQLQNQMAQCPAADPMLSVPGMIPNTAGTGGGIPNTVGGQNVGPAPTVNNGLPPPVLPMPGGTAGVARNVAGRTASVGEVSAQFGQNMFSSLSEPISNRCRTGQLNHCTRFETSIGQ